MRNLAHLPALLIVVGAILLLGALVWPHSKDRRDYWTDADAEARKEAGVRYHGLAHHRAHARTQEQIQHAKKELKEAKAHYREVDKAFYEAEDRYERPIRLMRFSGVACLALGALGYFLLHAAAGS